MLNQPTSSLMMNRMLGLRCCCCASVGMVNAVMVATRAARPNPRFRPRFMVMPPGGWLVADGDIHHPMRRPCPASDLDVRAGGTYRPVDRSMSASALSRWLSVLGTSAVLTIHFRNLLGADENFFGRSVEGLNVLAMSLRVTLQTNPDRRPRNAPAAKNHTG